MRRPAGHRQACRGFAASTHAELTLVYADLGVNRDFYDITNGNCGPYAGYLVLK
jgi:hypothetical protein